MNFKWHSISGAVTDIGTMLLVCHRLRLLKSWRVFWHLPPVQLWMSLHTCSFQNKSLKEDYLHSMYLSYVAVMFMIPMNEVIVFPSFNRCTPSITCYWKTIVGITLQLGRYITLITLIIVTHHVNTNNIMPHSN